MAIGQIEKLFDSKINTLRFEVVTGLANLKELKRHASITSRRIRPPSTKK
ncbi:hypothetical protein [Burkholderia ubonensis]|nr:hypothetical protein [Burkholderia ubonensis]